MEKLISDFRLMWTDMEWNMIKLSLLAYIVYKVSYAIGKVWANLNSAHLV